MRFKILLILLTGFLIICKKDFRVIEATMQEWTGGRQKTGRGVNYKITIIAETTSNKLELHELWINKKLCVHRLFNLANNEQGNTFNKNDTLILTGTVIINEYIVIGDIKKEPPFSFNEEIVIGYSLRNRMMYRPVSDIKILKPLFYR